jgi:hypothetical protein
MARRPKEIHEPQTIGSKKEKKLSIDTKVIEQTVDSFLIKYNIDNRIETYINIELDKVLNETTMLSNIGKKEKDHQLLFDIEFFKNLLNYAIPIIDSAIDIEINRTDFKDDIEKNIHIDIMENMRGKIELTMFSDSLNKLDLVIYHYLLKVLETKAVPFLEKHSIKNIRGFKVSIELFKYELIDIIGRHDQLGNFVQTIKSIIEQLLVKYNARTKIGQFYYNILMITPDYIVEKILNYLVFTALKNMNPIYLRALFSTYIGLIHTNIFSFYGAKLTKVKAGYFKQLDSLFEENFTHELNSYSLNVNQMMMDNMFLSFLMKNKRYLKANYEYLLDENSNPFFDINYYDFLYSYREDFSILDYLYYYNKFLKSTKNSFRKNANLYKIKHLYTKKGGNQSLKSYTYDQILETFYKPLIGFINDKDSVLEICKILSEELLFNLNPNGFVTSDFDKEYIGLDVYMNQVQMAIINLKKMINPLQIPETTLQNYYS